MNTTTGSAFEPLTPDEAAVLAQALSPACFKLTVNPNDFHDVLTCEGPANKRATSAKIAPVGPDHPCVRFHKDGKFHVRLKGATIKLTVESSKKETDDYYPVGVAFKMLKGGDAKLKLMAQDERAAVEKRLTDLNFSQSKIGCDKHDLTFTDEFKDKDCDDKYEFSVVIQRVSDGAIGIIDPPLDHEH